MQSVYVFPSEQANIRSGNFLDSKTCLAFVTISMLEIKQQVWSLYLNVSILYLECNALYSTVGTGWICSVLMQYVMQQAGDEVCSLALF